MTGPETGRPNADSGNPDSEEPLSPALARAVAALQTLPPASPDAVARVLARVDAADAQNARSRATARLAGALGLAAAGIGLVMFAPKPVAPPASADAPAAGAGAAPRTPAVRLARADATTADAPRFVRFRFVDPHARSVAVVGDFNQWNARATPLARDAEGTWAVSVALTPGRHAYRFVVDAAQPVLDPHAPVERDAELGVTHSVVVIGVP